MFNTNNIDSNLFRTVVDEGFCIGCGACAAFDPSITMSFDNYGCYKATRNGYKTTTVYDASKVCPFADGVPNELELAKEAFSPGLLYDDHIGYYAATFAGWVAESDYRLGGSSGGVATWLLVELLQLDLVDYVVHVGPNSTSNRNAPMFSYSISSSIDEIKSKAKSRYYPIELSQVLLKMREQPGRYAVVGIPCFIKAFRLACRECPDIKAKIQYTIAIVCGHLKSTRFGELMAWQCGILPDEIVSIDYRTKLTNSPANQYGITIHYCRNGQAGSITRPTVELFGSNWGHGFFKYKACDFCDDVVGETADVSIGDAWLPEYESDPAGTNLLIARSLPLLNIITNAIAEKRLLLEEISVQKAIASQEGGFRHRRQGLALRLANMDESGKWRPLKRVSPDSKYLTTRQKRIYETRSVISIASHEAYATARLHNNLDLFFRRMKPLIASYDKLYRRSIMERILTKLKHWIAATVNAILHPKD